MSIVIMGIITIVSNSMINHINVIIISIIMIINTDRGDDARTHRRRVAQGVADCDLLIAIRAHTTAYY